MSDDTRADAKERAIIEAFLKKHKDRVMAWAKAHGSIPPPVIITSQGDVVWVSRKDRRRILGAKR